VKINQLQLKDKKLFDKFFCLSPHSLSSFSFVNIFAWRDFFDFFWVMIEDNLCLFAKNEIGCFMYLPPLGKRVSSSLIDICFKIMDKGNLNKNISRIENIEEESKHSFKKLGLNLRQKDSEYLYQTKKLINLSGNSFKPKRASYNYFVKNYDFEICEFNPKLKAKCLKLYKNWARERKEKYKDTIYQAMLEDSFLANWVCFDYYKTLNLDSLVVKIKKEVKAYSLGFKLNSETFCILSEVTDLSFKGISQFIFREFCRKEHNFKFINAMDDSGLKNIKQAKLSYRPQKLIRSYIAQRNNV